jgi:putative hemin transport protein
MSSIAESKTSTLHTAWEELKKEKPTLRIRDCAQELGVSEAELLATTSWRLYY